MLRAEDMDCEKGCLAFDHCASNTDTASVVGLNLYTGEAHLGQVAPVDDAKPRSSTELGPVGGAAEPIQVLAQEGVHSGARMHDSIRKNDSRVAHAVSHL